MHQDNLVLHLVCCSSFPANYQKMMMTNYFNNSYWLIIAGILWGTALSAQCNSWEAHPKSVDVAKEKHQMYRDLFRSKKYEMAFPIWRALFQSVKAPKEAPSRHFKDGIKMYRVLAKQEVTKEKKALLVDTIVDLYQQLENCVGKNTVDKAWLGFSLYALRSQPVLAMEAFQESLDLGGNTTPSMVVVPAAQLAIYLYQQKHPTFTKAYLTRLYYQLQELVESNLIDQKEGDYQAKWKKAKSEFLKKQDELDGIWGCDFFEKKWKAIYITDSNVVVQNKLILNILKSKCGEISLLYQRIKANQVSLLLNTCNGTPINELTIYQQAICREKQANVFLKKGDTLQSENYLSKAHELYHEALKEETTMTHEESGTLYYKLAYQYFLKGNYTNARQFCRQASRYRPHWGEPYLLIGNMYVGSVNTCQTKEPKNLNGKVVIWAALDEWKKAKQIDPSIESRAMKNINIYKKYLPLNSNAFQAGLEKGKVYEIGCWIKQKTTVQVIME